MKNEKILYDRYSKEKGMPSNKLKILNSGNSPVDNYIEAKISIRQNIQEQSEITRHERNMRKAIEKQAEEILLKTLKDLLK